MKAHKITIFVLAALTLFAACKDSKNGLSGITYTEEISFDGLIDELHISNGIGVVISDSIATPYFETDSSLKDLIIAKNKKGTLTLRHSRDLKEVEAFQTTIYLPSSVLANVDEITVTEGSWLDCRTPIDCKKMDINLRAASKAQCLFDMPQGELDIELCGASTLYAKGIANEVEIDAKNASSILSEGDKRFAFEVVKLKCYLEEGSKAEVHCNGVIKGKAKGSSTLDYSGRADTKMTTEDNSKINKRM